jgi:DNA-binding NarL/FixJ family response regulator
MPKKTRVAIVDDHPIVRRGVSETFDEAKDFEVVGEGASAEDAVTLARDRKPDLVILDVTLPGGGIEAAAQIHQLFPDTAIMMLSIREDLAAVRAALKAGARGYVSKGVDADELVATARKLLAGQNYVSPELAARLVTEDQDAATSFKAGGAVGRSTLSPREQQILELIGTGYSNHEIADRLELTENTIKHYITPLLRKLGVRNRTEAALLLRARAQSEQIVSPPSQR